MSDKESFILINTLIKRIATVALTLTECQEHGVVKYSPQARQVPQQLVFSQDDGVLYEMEMSRVHG